LFVGNANSGSGKDRVKLIGTTSADTITVANAAVSFGALTINYSTTEIITVQSTTGGDSLTVNSGTAETVGTTAWGSGSSIVVNGGVLNLEANTGTPATSGSAAVANLDITVNGGRLNFHADQDIKSLSVPTGTSGSQAVDLSTPSTSGVYRSVRVYSGNQTALDAAKASIYSAMMNANVYGASDPTDGIFDSGAAAHSSNSGGTVAVGIGQKTDAFSTSYILIRPALKGDANLDGTVSIADQIDMNSHWNQTGVTWQEGDFSYDGTVNNTDNFQLQMNWGKVYA